MSKIKTLTKAELNEAIESGRFDIRPDNTVRVKQKGQTVNVYTLTVSEQ